MKKTKKITAPETTPISGHNNNQQGAIVLPLPTTAAEAANTGPSALTLPECAEAAVRNHRLASESEASSIELGKKAIQFAIACGAALNAAKDQLKHGKWRTWLEKNVPTMSKETANRYMRLEEESHVTDLNGCESLRQAYVRCGILKEVPRQTPPKGGAPSSMGVPLSASVSLNNAAAPEQGNPEKPAPEAVVAVQSKPEAKLDDSIWLSWGNPDLDMNLSIKDGEIVFDHSGERADNLYELLKPIAAWLRHYEAAQASQEPERLAA